jgi:diaminopimelate epimerase
MKVNFAKYQALGNSFLVVESSQARNRAAWGKFARAICDHATGVGADGLLVISRQRGVDCRADVYNSDGGWAEKSGNGIRIVALHLHRKKGDRKTFTIAMGGALNQVTLIKKVAGGYQIRAEIGVPDFRAKAVPVKTRQPHLINQKLNIGKELVIATCLSVGNPHCVVPVDSFDFDWQAMGSQIEHAPIFPNRTNVEFVRVINRNKLQVAEWERGAGATGSSGTGAAASVAALVMLGRIERKCEVRFETGTLLVSWRTEDNVIELSGPVTVVATGVFETR